MDIQYLLETSVKGLSGEVAVPFNTLPLEGVGLQAVTALSLRPLTYFSRQDRVPDARSAAVIQSLTVLRCPANARRQGVLWVDPTSTPFEPLGLEVHSGAAVLLGHDFFDPPRGFSTEASLGDNVPRRSVLCPAVV